MALNWSWSDHLGTARKTDRNGKVFYTDLYRGNAFLIEIYTDPETNYYTLISFWADEKHAKNCLDLKLWKGSRVILDDYKLSKSYSTAERRKLIEYLLKSGASIELLLSQG